MNVVKDKLTTNNQNWMESELGALNRSGDLCYTGKGF